MFPFSRSSKDPQPETETSSAKSEAEPHPLDALTGGVFSAATSGERAQRVRDWLASDPAEADMQAVFKELSAKDRGAARALRERLDELRRAKGQEALAVEWENKARALLDAARLNIADALAWQRDAAKAGAPLSREPLAGLRTQLVERIKLVEDLQQRVMVQREAAALLVQRIDLLSTKALSEAQAQQETLAQDVSSWREESAALTGDAQWPSVDLRFPPQLQEAQTQLDAVWGAFAPVLEQALAAAADASLPLPPVPVWADEIRVSRGEPAAAEEAAQPARPKIDPEQRDAAAKAVEAGVKLLEQAVTAGNTKNMNSATQALRQSLKTHGRLIDDALEARVHAALVSAGELEGWQRWSADKVREQLLARAEALLVKRKIKGPRKKRAAEDAQPAQTETAAVPAEQPVVEAADKAAAPASLAIESAAPEAAETPQMPEIDAETRTSPVTEPESVTEPTQDAAAPAEEAPVEAEAAATQGPAATTETQQTEPAGMAVAPASEPALEEGYEWAPAMGGRKLQDAIRKLRDEWKATDQSGPPNHGLWKRFDRACNAAYVFVEQWLEQMRAEAARNKQQRLTLIDELKAWSGTVAADDWKGLHRQLRRFADRWRSAGHVSEKVYSELHKQWRPLYQAAAAPLEAEQKLSITRRQDLIAQAQELAAEPRLRVSAVRELQQQWQAEAQAVPLDRRREQRMWDAFRKPMDEAFQRRGAEREQQRAAMSAHDQAVLEAAKELEAANASGDAERIRAAMERLEAVTRGETSPAPVAAPQDEAAAQEPKPAEPQAAAELAAGESTGKADAEAPAAAEVETTAPADEAQESDQDAAAAAPAEAAEDSQPQEPPKPAARPVVAVRGDDRPDARPARAAAGGGRAEGRRDGRRDDRRDDRRGGRSGPGGERRGGRDDRRGGRFAERGPREERGPRLGGAAFRAQRDAVEQAQTQLRKLAAQAHGEALAQLMQAWEQRQSEQLPSAQELGRGVSGGVRNRWSQALEQGGGSTETAATALLRLEMAAEVPTPAAQLPARRQLQLELLTRRNDPQPAETWREDVAEVLAAGHDEAQARRLQNVLKNLLRRR